MIEFGEEQRANAQRLIEWALEEDLYGVGDLTCHAIIAKDLPGVADVVARKEGVASGLPVVQKLIQHHNAGEDKVHFTPVISDGDSLQTGTKLGTFTGQMRSILMLERTALNFLQRLSGIASLTRQYVDLISGCDCKLLDTRKTTPGWRILEKYAVACGGGTNHRMGLYDAVMIKDNHLAALSGVADDPLTFAVNQAREKYQNTVEIVIEVDNLEQLTKVLKCEPDVVLLDNMDPDEMREAVQLRGDKPILLEASGGINLETVRAAAETGVDRISVGALTHSAPALDIGLDYQFK